MARKAKQFLVRKRKAPAYQYTDPKGVSMDITTGGVTMSETQWKAVQKSAKTTAGLNLDDFSVQAVEAPAQSEDASDN